MHASHSHALVRALWQDLLRGALKIAGAPDAAGYALQLAPAEPPTSSSHRARRQVCLQTVLRGEPQKAVGVDLGIAPPTIAGMLRAALTDMGLDMPFSRIPIAVPLLAHAAETGLVATSCEVTDRAPIEPVWQLTLSPPEQVLTSLLSPAECDVVTRYIAGESYAEIAMIRRSSSRTVANQLALSFKKLRASGRFELIRVLVEQSAQVGAPLTLKLQARAQEPQRLTA
jgi:DNA-binding CsgD family transcriptional regulator